MMLRLLTIATLAAALATGSTADPQTAADWQVRLKRDPSDVVALVNLGILSAKDGRYKEAQDYYRRALRRDPNNPDILLNLALAHYKDNNLKAAIPVFEKVLRRRPDQEQAKTLLGLSYYGTGDFKKAAARLDGIPAAHANPQLRQMLAQAFIWSGDINRGAIEVEGLLKDGSNSAVAHVLLGEAYDAQGKSEDALREFEAAARINDSEPNVHFAIGYLHWRDKRFDEAEAHLRRELAADPAHSQALAYLGDIELQRSNIGEAARLLKTAVRLREDIRIAQYDLGVLAQKSDSHADAIPYFQRAVQLAPDRADAHYRLATSYRVLGRTQDSDKELAAVRTLHEKKSEDTVYKISAPPQPAPDKP
jgi:tetratricopeptide (TPR) repeat protein